MNYLLIILWYATKSGFYMTTSDIQLRGCTEKKLQSTSQSQTCTPKKVMVTVVWWSAASLIHYSFLNPNEIITSEKVCWANWWDAPKTATSGAGIGQQNGPNSSPWLCLTIHHPTSASKDEQIRLWSFTSIQFSSVTQSCPILCYPIDCRPPCPSPILGACSNSCPLSQ